MGVTSKYTALLGAMLCAVAVTASTAAAGTKRRAHPYATRWTRPLRTALFDPFAFNGSQYETAFGMTRRVGASYVRIAISWNEVAPAAPAVPSDAADPTWTGYSWGWVDTKVTAAEAAGLTPYLDIGSAPAWALARPASKENMPKVRLLRQFARAVALHYDGNHGAPPVHVFQVWNEPNLSLDLSPPRPAVYRWMVNAVAASIHGVDRRNIVVAGGLDPFKNRAKSWHTVAPLAFMRALLCLSKGKHPHRTCRHQVHFDVWSHHPYTFGGPFGHAKYRDDVSLGDLPKMRALLRAGKRRHRIVSRHPVQFWVTEFGWDSKPPRRHAAPVRLAARWTAASLYQMWRSGVSLVTWYLLEDQPSPSPYQSGLYFHAKSLDHARAKPVRRALRFPFVAYRRRHSLRVWGRDATSDKRLVTIQRRHGVRGHWRTVARIRSNRFGIFKATLRPAATRKDWIRAVAHGSGKSLPFSLRVPKARHIGPWGN